MRLMQNQRRWFATRTLVVFCMVLAFLTNTNVARADAPLKATSAQARGSATSAADEVKVDQGLALLKRGSQDDLRQAYRLFEEAAKAKNSDAEFNLGILYLNGQGGPKSDKEAAYWFRRAAEKGHAIAQYNLAIMLEGGEGVSKDDTESAKWFREAADRGHVISAYNIGVMYAEARGVQRSDFMATQYLKRAAGQGYIRAQAYMALEGLGGPVDYAKAASLYDKAAKSGDASSQYLMGYMYAKGLGVTKDYDKTLFWMKSAATQGHAKAQEFLRMIGRQ